MKTEFTLREIAEKAKIENIRTARHYLKKILPAHHLRGRGKYVRYGEDTLNTFLLLMKLKKETPLQLEQISSVLHAMDQTQIDRIVSGEEPLELGIAVKDGKGRISIPDGSVHAGKDMLFVDGDQVQKVCSDDPVQYFADLKDQARDEQAWQEMTISDRVQIRYKGVLSYDQLDELRIVSRILKATVEREE